MLTPSRSLNYVSENTKNIIPSVKSEIEKRTDGGKVEEVYAPTPDEKLNTKIFYRNNSKSGL